MPLTKVKSGGVSDSITLTSPDINAPDIDGGTIDNAVIGGSTAAAGSFTTITATGGSSSNWNTAYGWGDHSTQSYATQTYVGTAVSNLVDSSPAALDTLNELAAALGDDPNFATTVTNSIALKAPLASPSFTGTATITQSGNNVGLLVTGGGYNYTAKFESSDAEANIIIEDSNSTNNGNMIGVATNDMYFITNTVERLRIESGGGISTYPPAGGTFVINENGADADFRVESDINTHMLFVDAGNNRVGIGLSNPQQSFAVQLATADRVGTFYDTGTNGNSMYNGAAVLGVSRSSNGSTSLNGPIFEVGRDNGLNATYNVSDSFLTVRSDSTVVNEDSQDYDFRVESNGNDNMLFVDGGDNRVGIGATGGSQTGSNFYVEGRTTLYNGSTTGGSVILTDGYTPSSDDHILNIGTQRSSGGPFISYGLGHAQNSDGLWKSTYDNFSGSHSVLVLNGSTLEYHLDVSNSQTTVGDTVAVKNGYKVGRSGTVFNDDGYSEFDFRVASDAYSNCIHVNAGDNSVTFHKSVQSVSTSGFTIGIPSAGVTSSMPSGNTYHVYRSDGVDNGYKFYVNFGGQILSTSTSISGLSDERLKENIVDLETGLTEVIALKPRRFDWKGNGNKNVAGFIAQEVETVLPELIGDFLHDDLADAKSVKMGDMVPTLVKAIQEQQTLIESLTARIAALEA
jgi:hypothetical protein